VLKFVRSFKSDDAVSGPTAVRSPSTFRAPSAVTSANVRASLFTAASVAVSVVTTMRAFSTVRDQHLYPFRADVQFKRSAVDNERIGAGRIIDRRRLVSRRHHHHPGPGQGLGIDALKRVGCSEAIKASAGKPQQRSP
jgi:hypothetical protein